MMPFSGGSQFVAHVGQEGALGPVRGFGGVAGLRQFGGTRQHPFFQLVTMPGQRLFSPPALGNVAGDLRGADDSTFVVPDRRQRDRNFKHVTILGNPRGFIVLDRFATSDRGKQPLFLVVTLRGNHRQDRLPEDLGCRIAEELFRAMVPTGDDAVQALADDRIFRRGDDQCQQAPLLLQPFLGRLLGLPQGVLHALAQEHLALQLRIGQPEVGGLPFQPRTRQAQIHLGTYPHQQFFLLEWLVQEVYSAELEPLDTLLPLADRAENHHRDIAALVPRLEPPQDFKTVHPRHAQVEQDELRPLQRHRSKRQFPAVRRQHLIAGRTQGIGQQLQRRQRILDDEDGALVHASLSIPVSGVAAAFSACRIAE
jgi:hypothetical protein